MNFNELALYHKAIKSDCTNLPPRDLMVNLKTNSCYEFEIEKSGISSIEISFQMSQMIAVFAKV